MCRGMVDLACQNQKDMTSSRNCLYVTGNISFQIFLFPEKMTD